MAGKYERELLAKLNKLPNTLIQRVTGSATGEQGIGDLIGVIKGNPYLIEVKSTKKEKYYLSFDKEQFNQIVKSVKGIDITPILAVRFKAKKFSKLREEHKQSDFEGNFREFIEEKYEPTWKFVDLNMEITKVTRETKSDYEWEVI